MLLVGTAGFAILALAGLPLIERYVVLPAVALALFAAAAALGWQVLAPGSTRRAWQAGGITALITGALLAPGQVRQLADVRELAGQQRERQLALREFASRLRDVPARCTVAVPSSQDAQAIVLFADLRSGEIEVAAEGRAADLRVLDRSEPESVAGRTLAQGGGLALVDARRNHGC